VTATVQLSALHAEMCVLADKDPLSDDEEARWRQLVPHWVALAKRVNEDRN
jgi:hypothetical protein